MPSSEAAPTNRSVVALLVAVFCSSAASMGGVTALGKQVYDLTERDLDLGLIGLAEFAPAALLVLVTGSVADRYDRRRVGALAMAGEGVAAAALAWYATTQPTAVGPIFALVVGFGIARAFVAPAVRSIPADIVPPERMPWLVPRFSATWQAALIVGPVLAGVLYAVDPALPYVGMVVLLVLGAAALLMIEPVSTARGSRADRPRPTMHEALEGLRFIRHHPILLGAISLDLFAVLFGGAIALLPAIAENRLGVGSIGLGWLRAAGGIGAGLVTLSLVRRPLRRRIGRTLLAAVALFGAGTIVLGMTRNYVIAFIAIVVLSGADAVSVFIRATLVPLVTPARTRGRVMAVENVFIGASNELGAFESGVAGELLGTSGAVILGGVATLTIALGWGVLFPALRDVDRFPETAAGRESVADP